MTFDCQRFRTASQQRRAQGQRNTFTTIGAPRIGDILTRRTLPSPQGDHDIQVLVCEARDIIACLADGDQVLMSDFRPRFATRWGLKGTAVKATLNMGGDEKFILDEGVEIPLSACNRKMRFTVLFVAEQRHAHHEPQYDESAVRTMVAGIAPTRAELAAIG